jgi:tetratricopeptide (TPR) repeat protein
MANALPSPTAAPFERALAQFKMGLKKRDQETFKKTTLTDLKNTIGELQAKQHASRRLQGLNRIQPFLEAMEQFGKAIAIFANTNELVAFIWGPVKLLLLISSTFVDSFKELLSIYQHIGERLPNIMRYEEVFRSNGEMQGVLALIYKDILRFHMAALKYFQASRECSQNFSRRQYRC